MTQGNDGYTAFQGFIDAKLHSLLTDTLSESTIAIDYSEYVGLADYAQGLSGAEIAGFEPADIPGDPDDTMTVVPWQVGRWTVPGNPLAFAAAAAPSFASGAFRIPLANFVIIPFGDGAFAPA